MDWVLVDELSVTLGDVVGWVSAAAMIIGGVVPYVPQYRQIRRTRDADGFSLHVCLALLIANTLRIMFWFGKRYEIPLLAQSVVMNVTMFAMIRLCVEVRNENRVVKARERTFSANAYETTGPTRAPTRKRASHTICDLDGKYFWNWTDFQSYVDFVLLFSVASAALTYAFVDVTIFIEILGFFAVLTEATLGVPQFIRNYTNKSTEGMSATMVVMWTCGDAFKTAYFFVRDAPIQFWTCGLLQVSLDIAILAQVRLYHNSAPIARRPSRPD